MHVYFFGESALLLLYIIIYIHTSMCVYIYTLFILYRYIRYIHRHKHDDLGTKETNVLCQEFRSCMRARPLSSRKATSWAIGITAGAIKDNHQEIPGIHTIKTYIYNGWWCQTFDFFHNLWDNPPHWLICFKMVKTTNQIYIYIHT